MEEKGKNANSGLRSKGIVKSVDEAFLETLRRQIAELTLLVAEMEALLDKMADEVTLYSKGVLKSD